MSKTNAYVEVVNPQTNQVGRGWGLWDSAEPCSDMARLNALNIAAMYAFQYAGCPPGAGLITYATWHCDENKILEGDISFFEANALKQKTFKSVPDQQGIQNRPVDLGDLD